MAWTSDSTGRWARDWLGWSGFSRFFSQLVAWTFPGEETGGIEARFEVREGRTTLHVESVEADGSPRDFYSTSATLVGPDFTSSTVPLVQIAPGVYEAPLGEVGAGAYLIRVTQTRPGTTPLGRTLGLVAPTPAEYRVLGANEPFLAALRSATGGAEMLTALDPWVHDLRTTSSSTDLWPLLLVLALLLWPLDIALRRVSVGRREFAAAGAWVRALPSRRRAVGRRTVTSEGLLAARGRATSAGTRAALRGEPATVASTDRTAQEATPDAEPTTSRDAGTGRPGERDPPRRPSRPPLRHHPPGPRRPPIPADTMARLRDAKRRARDR